MSEQVTHTRKAADSTLCNRCAQLALHRKKELSRKQCVQKRMGSVAEVYIRVA
jgi:hypothetical protein